MKIKLKMDKKAILGFFVQNVEKVVFAAVVVCFALIVYGATARERFTVTPDQLAERASRAQQSWAKTALAPPPFEEDKYDNLAKQSQKPIEVAKYLPLRGGERAGWKPWNAPLVAQGRKRGQPRLYAVEGLRGTAGRGRVSVTVGAGDLAGMGALGGGSATSSIQGQRWVVLTALVPLQKQTQAFLDAYSNSAGSDDVPLGADVPTYQPCVVQRLDVSGAKSSEPPDWNRSETIYFSYARDKAKSLWSSSGITPSADVDPRFIDEQLCFRLPPLLDRQPDESMAHSPEIPLVQSNPAELRGSAEPAPAPQRSDDPFFSESSPLSGGSTPERVRPSAGFGGQAPASASDGADQSVEYKLFRFFDLNVQPGKRYLYRVRLVLRNPNDGVADTYLSDEVLERRKRLIQQEEEAKAKGDAATANEALLQRRYLLSNWSEPTDVIAVPRESRLLAVSVQNLSNTPPKGTAMLVTWVQDQGIEAFNEMQVLRGKVANFPGCRFPDAPPQAPRRGGGFRGARGERGDLGLPQPIDVQAAESLLVDHVTDVLVLDLHGGQLLPGRVRLERPGAMLLLDPDGTLVVHRELDDLAECNALREQTLSAAQPGYGYPGGTFGSGPGGNLELLDPGRGRRD